LNGVLAIGLEEGDMVGMLEGFEDGLIVAP
jgi:hypothetical protein